MTKEKQKFEMLLLSAVVPTEENPRILRDDDPKLVELSKSIRAVGVLEPILVRSIEQGKDQNGKVYEVRAGERRRRAALMAGLTEIPAIVRTMTDKEALEITITENMQRDDLHPIEEANGINTLLNKGWTQDQVASQLGKPVTWIARRSKLSGLTERWREMISDTKCGVSKWPASHLEIVAKFPEEIQVMAAERYDDRENDTELYWGPVEAETLKDIREYFADNLHLLKFASWDIKEEGLVEGAPTCEQCQARSDVQPELWDSEDFITGDEDFEEEETKKKRKVTMEARCLNAECWERKKAVIIERQIEKHRAKQPDLILVSCHNSPENRNEKWKDNTSFYWHLDRSRKKGPDRKPCFVVDGQYAGEFFWGKTCSGRGINTGKKKGPTPLKERRAQYKKFRGRIVVGKVIAWLRKWSEGKEPLPNISDDTKLRLVYIFGINTSDRPHDYIFNPWRLYDKIAKEQRSLNLLIDDLTRSTCLVLCNELRTAVMQGDPPVKDAKNICGVMLLDHKALWAEAEKEKPYPKSWAKLNEDGTPKTKKEEPKRKQKEKKETKKVATKKKATKKSKGTKETGKAERQ